MDRYGDSMLEMLRRENIEARWVLRQPGRTDVGFVMLAPDGIPAITSAADINQGFSAEVVERARDIIESASIVVCQLEAPDEAAIAAFRLARLSGALTILNPAPARELDPELVSLTDILVPNQHEARTMLGFEPREDLLASRLRDDLRVSTVVVTAGEGGAWSAAPEGVRHHPAPPANAVDTTGAGDAFIGALASALRLRRELRAAVDFAVAAATLAVTRSGTIPSYPTAVEVAATAPTPMKEA
jgi:ribokinase